MFIQRDSIQEMRMKHFRPTIVQSIRYLANDYGSVFRYDARAKQIV